jgi:recombinational DNA repair ATPase RecF
METEQTMQEIMELLKALQKTSDSVRKADREALNEMSASMKSDREQMLAEISNRMDENSGEMDAKMEAKQVEMRSTVCAFRSELKEIIQHEMKAVIQPIWADLDETTACNGATETGPFQE